MWTYLTLLDHAVVMDLSCFVCSVEDPPGVIHTPSILENCEGGRRSIFCGTSGVLRNMYASFPASFHFPGASHLKSSRCHLVLLMLTCSPVV